MTTAATVRRTPPRDRLRSTLLGLVLPLLLLATAIVVVLGWRDELPDPVATHWGPDGVNGTGSLTGLVVLVAAIGTACVVGGWALAYFVGFAASVRRTAVGMSLGLAGFLSAMLVGTLAVQRGLDDASATGDVDGVIYAALAIGAALGAGGALLVPSDPPQPAAADDPAAAPSTLELPAGVRSAWVQQLGTPALRWVGVMTGLVFAVLGVVAGLALLFVPLGVLLGALVAAFSSFTVVVDRRGLGVRGSFGWPRLHVPADEVLDATVEQVNPLRDFGGWGYRVGRGGRVGVVTRAGEALVVERTGGRRSVVTVDDAATGATLLRAFAAQARTGQ